MSGRATETPAIANGISRQAVHTVKRTSAPRGVDDLMTISFEEWSRPRTPPTGTAGPTAAGRRRQPPVVVPGSGISARRVSASSPGGWNGPRPGADARVRRGGGAAALRARGRAPVAEPAGAVQARRAAGGAPRRAPVRP